MKINKNSLLRSPFAKFKCSKQLQHFVAKAREAETNDHDSVYTDMDDNSMPEITLHS